MQALDLFLAQDNQTQKKWEKQGKKKKDIEMEGKRFNARNKFSATMLKAADRKGI